MITYGRMEPEDLDWIIDNLWARGEGEMRAHGIFDKADLKTRLISMGHEHAYCLKLYDEPVAAFGAYKVHGLKMYSTWFVATDSFVEAAFPITRFMKGFVRDSVNAHPGYDLELISAVDNLDAPRWFKLLGFEPVEPSEGVFTRYLYKR